MGDEDTYLVIQQGGSGGEFYTDGHDSKGLAQDMINAHAAASYHTFGPYPISEGLSKLDLNEWTEMLALITQACTDVSSRVYAPVDEAAVAELVAEQESGKKGSEEDGEAPSRAEDDSLPSSERTPKGCSCVCIL